MYEFYFRDDPINTPNFYFKIETETFFLYSGFYHIYYYIQLLIDDLKTHDIYVFILLYLFSLLSICLQVSAV